MEDNILVELFNVKKVQKMFGTEILTWTESYIIDTLASKYCIENENCQLMHVLEDMFEETGVAPTMGELLSICKERGIMKKYVAINTAKISTPQEYNDHMFAVYCHNLHEGISIDSVDAMAHLIHEHNDSSNIEFYILNESGEDIVIKNGEHFDMTPNAQLSVHVMTDDDEYDNFGCIYASLSFYEKEEEE